jgi:hypothetical protein
MLLCISVPGPWWPIGEDVRCGIRRAMRKYKNNKISVIIRVRVRCEVLKAEIKKFSCNRYIKILHIVNLQTKTGQGFLAKTGIFPFAYELKFHLFCMKNGHERNDFCVYSLPQNFIANHAN